MILTSELRNTNSDTQSSVMTHLMLNETENQIRDLVYAYVIKANETGIFLLPL